MIVKSPVVFSVELIFARYCILYETCVEKNYCINIYPKDNSYQL